MKHTINITRIKAVSNALGNLKENVVFVGGATVSLYADRETEESRPTDDVDVLVEISSRKAYAELEEQLRSIGFSHDVNAGFVGRFLMDGLIVDVMPTDETILGFSNQWYKEGFQSAVNYSIDEMHSVNIFTAPIFIATKLEAFKNRGNNDGRLSSDFEDIIFVLENRSTIWEELKNTKGPLNSYLMSTFESLRNEKYIEEWIESHSSQRISSILEGMDYLLA
ncbi:hypothetical protein [Lacibacter sp.]|uniref:hypothetical protein n=1 Tax=Lacibacter sp. TaxID=1915409 RepID=UPI002B4B172A|nr:hypothetical protein [Lacibacter sp.]HLP37757.1 hypothetical protein [Lacibacter sp.]